MPAALGGTHPRPRPESESGGRGRGKRKGSTAQSSADPITNKGQDTMMMPKMPAMGRAKATRECACGCGGATKSTWAAGHDGRATGWAIRIERGMAWDDIPDNEKAGAAIMSARRANKQAKAQQAITEAA